MSPQRQPDAVIIGGGLHGLSAALHLAAAGLRPLVLEKDYPGRHASGVNAGGVRRLGRDLAEVPLSVAAMELWHRIEDLVDDPCGFTACGQIKVAETEAELAALRGRAQQVRAIGYDHEEIIDAAALRDRVPAIARHCPGAMICRSDGAADPFRTVTAFRRKAVAQGARLVTGAKAQRVVRRGQAWVVETASETYQAPILINAAGAWSGEIARQLGEPVPLRAIAPMLMITERTAPFLAPVLGAQGRALSFKQRSNGTVLIGGGHRGVAEPQANRSSVALAGLRTSAQTVAALFPRLRSVRVNRFWSGIEGLMPDGIPVIGPSATEDGAFHCFGFSAHGFQLAPVTGRILSELVVQGATALPIDAFRISRFNSAARVTRRD